MSSNEKDDVCYAQPKTFADRVVIANAFVERQKYALPFYVDPIDNKADELYAGWPERLYVIDEKGIIAYKGEVGPFGYKPEELEAWLELRWTN